MIYLDGNFLHYSVFRVASVYSAVNKPAQQSETLPPKALAAVGDPKATFCCFLERSSIHSMLISSH